MNTMLTYIAEETEVGRRILDERSQKLSPFVKLLEASTPVTRIWLLATGSSYNASLCARLYIEKMAGISVEVREPFQFCEYETLPSDVDLVIAVTQKGTSLSTIQAIRKIREAGGTPVIALTSVMDSPVTREGIPVMDMNCGVETVGFSTKGVIATVMGLMLMGLEMAKHNGRLTDEADAVAKLAKAVALFRETADAAGRFFTAHKEELTGLERYSIIGYGPNLGTAKEAETKITETVRVPAQGFEVEAYMHGPIFELKREYGVFLTHMGNGPAYRRSLQLEEFVQSYCDHVFVLTSDESRKDKPKTLWVPIPGENELISPLLLLIPYQVLSYEISTARGITLEKPVYTDFRRRLGSKVGEKDAL